MNPSGHPSQPQSSNAYYPPPPSYSLPGQEPPKDTYPATAPPPVGLNAWGAELANSKPGIQRQPQQQQQQQQPQQSPQTTIIYANAVQFGPYPMRYTCPNCNAHVMTETHSTPGVLTYILCFLTGSLFCCLIPFCIRECKDIEHRCPNCQHKLGLFKRI